MGANKSLLCLTIANAFYAGFMRSLGNLASGIFNPFGYTPFTVSMIGLIMLVGGILGVVVSGIIIDRTQAYKRLIQVMMVAAAIVLGLTIQCTFAQGPIGMIYFYVGALGFAMASI